MKVTGPSNPHSQALIQLLGKSSEAPIWRRISKELALARRSRRPVNLDQINQLVTDNDTIIVPAKVLGEGMLSKKVTIGALSFSEEALRKITETGGSPLSIAELWEKNPSGSNIRIIK